MRRREFITLLGGAAIVRQATNLSDLELPMLLPRITSPTDYYPVQQLQLMRFDGKRWVRCDATAD